MAGCKLLLLVFCCILMLHLEAQTDIDGIMMTKTNFCTGVVYSHSSWKNYWEGTFKRDNANLGTVSTKMIGVMGNYGITDKINILFSVPYVQTNASAGSMKGLKGVQDLSLWVKWMPVDIQIGKSNFSAYGVAGYSFPVSDYVADFLPLAIGLRSKNLSIRAIADYQIGKFFVTGSATYIQRSNIKIDRDAYYTTEMHYTNEVKMPNAASFNFRVGYRTNTLTAEAVLSNWTTLGGFDITKNNMPFPSNEMNATRAGLALKYTTKQLPGLSFIAASNLTLTGRNVGEATDFSGGIFYVLDFKKKNKKNSPDPKNIIMKKQCLYVMSLVLLIGWGTGCSKTIDEENLGYPDLNPSKTDINAGVWKTVLLTTPDEFAVAPPAATNTPGYIAELNEIKSWQSTVTKEQKEIIRYWSAGAVLRWNEIMRELVAKHNLPPYQNADGTYPVPNANNPFAYPQFPFSNPPFAARAYAYVSAAQYDALVASHHFKKLYNRSAPYKFDSSIKVMIAKSDLPSYPSEDGAIAGVTVELMKLFSLPTWHLYSKKPTNINCIASWREPMCVAS